MTDVLKRIRQAAAEIKDIARVRDADESTAEQADVRLRGADQNAFDATAAA